MAEEIKIEEKEVYRNTQSSYEEISEKKTSKLGYLLLIIMVAFIIVVGETIFSDLSDVPSRPQHPSYCVDDLFNNLETRTYIGCGNYNYEDFNSIDKNFEIDTQYIGIKSKLDDLIAINKNIDTVKNDIRSLGYKVEDLSNDYNLSLQEKIAGEESIINKNGIKQNITNSRTRIDSLKYNLAVLEGEQNLKLAELKPGIEALKISYKNAIDEYQTQRAWYKFKVFLLTLIFVLPFFLLSVRYYLRLKRKNSPYTIILTATTTAFSILFLQVMLLFLYDILPKKWLGLIFDFFLQFAFLRYVLYYGSVILIIVIFGGIVFYIQKKVFDPVKVAVRRLKDGKCPGCSFPVDTNNNFCPDCGLQLKETCKNCKKQKVRYLSHCPHCGKE